MPVLAVEHLEVRYTHTPRMGFRPAAKTVLQDITFSLSEGEVLGLIGESGSGKTTLARCIAGLIQPQSGSIELDGINMFPRSENRKTAGSKIQMVFQAYSASLDPQLTVERIMLEGLIDKEDGRNGFDRKATAKQLCSLVGLPDEILGSYPRQLSGGQRQRVAIARALSVEPRLLILDEPTSALDVLTQAHILGLIQRIQERHPLGILFITHNIANCMLLCDRIAVLHHGSIVETGVTKEIGTHPSHPYTQQLLASMH